ncbi:MAG: phosphatidate cytidylyltransferase [Muribaculaceae bacterium]|nr:phosphatidate cytidylyltransferase [Muribaculaceae bacterium]MDE7369340.1 phosphatidate cytidylyltransferase [Muribaculaceae bacterium]
MNNVITRAISGTAYITLVVCSIISGPWTFLGLTVIFAVFSAIELKHIDRSKSGNTPRPLIDCLDICGILFMIVSASLASNSEIGLESIPAFIIPYTFYLIARGIIEIYVKEENPLDSLGSSALVQIYIGLPLATLNLLYNTVGANLVLAMFIFIWVNDTGAFCVGTMFGRRRLFERISPKKSWEGFWGGLAFCIAFAVLFALVFDNFFYNFPVNMFIGFAIVVSVFATFGDLFESLLKRTAGVKDSGKIMPGHGGILDRIDSLLMVGPICYCFLLIAKSFLN